MNDLAKVLLIGCNHFDMGQVTDYMKIGEFDVLSERRQLEVADVIERIKNFQPTKVAVESLKEKQNVLTQSYQSYCQGELKPSKNEIVQIGFRVAKEMKHKLVYAVDWNAERAESIFTYGENHEPDAFQKIIEPIKSRVKIANEHLYKLALKDYLVYLNSPTYIEEDHQAYMQLALLGTEESPVGIQWVNDYWYYRNMLIYKNIIQLATTSEERIFVLYGAGHIYLLKQFLQSSGLVDVEVVANYFAD